MESILGNECYNGNIQNYGPGGVRESDGRAFRYPLTLRGKDGAVTKIRDAHVPSATSTEDLLRGYYAFGANRLDVVAGLDKILTFLEQQHGLVIPR
jgi:hypothetical protein